MTSFNFSTCWKGFHRPRYWISGFIWWVVGWYRLLCSSVNHVQCIGLPGSVPQMYQHRCFSQLILHREGALQLKEGEMSRTGLRLYFELGCTSCTGL